MRAGYCLMGWGNVVAAYSVVAPPRIRRSCPRRDRARDMPWQSPPPREARCRPTRRVLFGLGVRGAALFDENLSKKGWIGKIKKETLNNNIPLLDICLGMQLLANKGYEGGEYEGLGLIPGEVKKFQPGCLPFQ